MADDDMVAGYLDGLADDRDVLPDSLSNRSARYCHGWQNGRDDRVRRPRPPAAALRLEAAAAEIADALRG